MAVTNYVGIGVPPRGTRCHRRLRIDDYVSVDGLPREAHVVDLWYPLLSDDPNQQVLDVSIDLDQPLDLGHDPEHGNRMVHLRLPRPLPPRLGFRVSYLVSRSSQPGQGFRSQAGQVPGHPLLVRDLQVDLPAHEERWMRRTAAHAVASLADPLDRARRLSAALGPSRSEPGTLERFASLCRLAGIPTRLVAGLLLSGGGDGVLCHRWAELFVADRGWVPSDPLCDDACALGLDHVSRVRGQNLLLQPVQRGPRLDVFAGPYSEVDGRPHPAHSRVRVLVEASPTDETSARVPGARVPDLGGLLAEELALLRPPPGWIRVTRGALLPPAAPEDWLYVLARGRVRLTRLTATGRRLELGVLRAPAFLLGERIRRGVAECVEDSELRPLSRDQVLHVARRRPDFGFRLLETFGERLVESEDRLEYLAYHSVPERLALALLRGRGRDGALDGVTHQQLGDVVGASRETVTKVLGQFQAEGLVQVLHRRVRVLDPARLEETLEHA